MSDGNKPDLSAMLNKNKISSHVDEDGNLDISAYAELTEKEKAEIKAVAAKQVAEELRSARKKAFLAEQVASYRSAAKPGQEQRKITIDLPGHSDRLKIDGRDYHHGVTYTVSKDQYDSMRDMCARAWEHENEVGGANRDLYKGRAPINAVISPGGEQSRLSPTVRF